MPNIFRTDINILSARRVVVNGTAEGANGVANVEIFDGDTDLGSANLSGAGDWNFTVGLPKSSASRQLHAVVTDGLGHDTDIESKFVLATNNPSTGLILQMSTDVSHVNIFDGNGRLLTDMTRNNPNNLESYAVNGHGGAVPFFVFGGLDQEINNFHVAKESHDTLDLSSSSLHTLAQVLRHTSTFQGDTTIHVDAQTTVKLDGITKNQLAHHANVFSFG